MLNDKCRMVGFAPLHPPYKTVLFRLVTLSLHPPYELRTLYLQFVGWVKRSVTHHFLCCFGGFRYRFTHPTNFIFAICRVGEAERNPPFPNCIGMHTGRETSGLHSHAKRGNEINGRFRYRYTHPTKKSYSGFGCRFTHPTFLIPRIGCRQFRIFLPWSLEV